VKIVGRVEKDVLDSRCEKSAHGWDLQASYLTKCFECDKVLNYTQIGAIDLSSVGGDKMGVKPFCSSKCKKVYCNETK